jgi:hypothetical protein
VKAIKVGPPRLEWDFREIGEGELPVAIQYELLRSHEYFRKRHAKKTHHDLVRALLDEWGGFPKLPWLAHDQTKRKTYAKWAVSVRPRALNVYPVTGGSARWDRVAAMRSHIHGENAAAKWWLMRVDLDSNATTDELVAEFNRWIRDARKGRGPKRGNGGNRMRFDLLKAIAAFRLSNFGFTYAEAQTFLKDECKSGGFAKPEVWPFYEEKCGWSFAIKRAKTAIAEAGSWLF